MPNFSIYCAGVLREFFRGFVEGYREAADAWGY